MQFRPEMIAKIAAGEKTETRRIVKPGEYIDAWSGLAVFTATERIKWFVGRDYAVTPGRGKPGVMRIRIMGLKYRSDLHDITEAEARREGFQSVDEFRAYWDTVNNRPGARWADNPPVWVVQFEVVTE